MSKGGKRKNAGKKTTWESGCSFQETTVIRVPKVLKLKILEIAHVLDAGTEIYIDKKLINQKEK